MPVLSESKYAPAMGAPYLLLAFTLLAICSFVMRRRYTRTPTISARQTQTPMFEEKSESSEFQQEPKVAQQEQQFMPTSNKKPRIPRPPPPPPFTPPTLAMLPPSELQLQTQFQQQGPLVATQDFSFSNASYYSPISSSPIPTFDSPTTMISSFEPVETFDGVDIPRRRSYTKTTNAGMDVQGEIVMAEGWRRHTRVFGGGVCKACEESEKRMSA